METRRQRRVMRRRLRKVGATLAVVTALGVTGAVGGTAFAGHSGSNSGCSNGSCHSNSVDSQDGTTHGLESQGTGHFFTTDDHGGRSDRPQ
jgi:hypothetical protein